MAAHFGLDLGFSSIKVLQVKKLSQGYQVVASGITPTPVPLESTAEADQVVLVETIKKLVKDAGIKTREVAVSVPESQVTSKIIELPYLSQGELASSIEFEAEQHIPLPLSEVELSWENLTPESEKQKEKILVLLVAVRKTVLERLLSLLDRAQLLPQVVETEIVSVARVLTLNNPGGNFMLVDLGRKTTDMAIINNGHLAFIYSSATGGDALTRAVASNLRLDFTRAEEYKRSYGLNPQVLEGKVAGALEPVFRILVDTMKKALFGFPQKDVNPIKTLFLCGGAAKMPELTGFLAKNLNLEVVVADPFINFVKNETFPAALQELAPMFDTVTGLALREI